MVGLIRSVVLILLLAHLNGLNCHETVALSSATRVKATDIVPPIIPCPPGFVNYESECIRSIVQTEMANVLHQCPAGYTLIGNGMCYQSVTNCPTGYSFNGHQCVPDVSHCPYDSSCPSGYHFNGVACVPVQNQFNQIPALLSCPQGFTNENGRCTKRQTVVKSESPLGGPVCPSGYVMVGAMCHRQIIGSSNQIIDPRLTDGDKDQPRNILVEIELNQHINILNDMNIPINITNINNQTIAIDTAKVIQGSLQENSNNNKTEKCCEVVSPRICKQRPNNDWFCSHRRIEKCGDICTAPVVYLRKSEPLFESDWMVIPPRESSFQNSISPPLTAMLTQSHDCSMCRHGNFCPSYCSTYDCGAKNTCEYMNQGDYCTRFGGRACTQDFGCTDEGYCA